MDDVQLSLSLTSMVLCLFAGLTNLLKKGIEDSNGGVVKQNVLRGYLKTVNRNTLQRSSLVLDVRLEHRETACVPVFRPDARSLTVCCSFRCIAGERA